MLHFKLRCLAWVESCLKVRRGFVRCRGWKVPKVIVYQNVPCLPEEEYISECILLWLDLLKSISVPPELGRMLRRGAWPWSLAVFMLRRESVQLAGSYWGQEVWNQTWAHISMPLSLFAWSWRSLFTFLNLGLLCRIRMGMLTSMAPDEGFSKCAT